jgi:hypothetical protein
MLRFTVCAAALLLAAPAHAQLIRSGTGRMVRQSGQSPVLDRYVFAPSGAAVTSSLRGTPLTVSGPATTVCDPARTPQCWTAPANTAAVGPDGALIYGARTSRLLWNQDLSNGAWIKRGDAACVASPEPAPDGTMTAWRCTVGLVNQHDVYQTVASGFGASVALTAAAWIRRVSEAGAITIDPTSSGIGSITIDLAEAGSAWRRYSWAGTTSAAGGSGFKLSAASTVTVDVWRPWLVEGSVAGPDAEVGANPLSIARHALSSDALPPGGQPFCICVSATPDMSAPWHTSGIPSRVLFGLGPNTGANTMRVRVGATGNLIIDVYDATGTVKTWTAAGAFSGSGETSVAVCHSPAGAVTVAVGGQVVAATESGNGTGQFVPRDVLSIGGASPAGVFPLQGAVRQIAFTRAAAPESCP